MERALDDLEAFSVTIDNIQTQRLKPVQTIKNQPCVTDPRLKGVHRGISINFPKTFFYKWFFMENINMGTLLTLSTIFIKVWKLSLSLTNSPYNTRATLPCKWRRHGFINWRKFQQKSHKTSSTGKRRRLSILWSIRFASVRLKSTVNVVRGLEIWW